jgi:hypothetical protein
MLRSLIRCGALAGALGLGACDLVVTNPNNPETKRVLASPADVESLLGTEFLRWHIAMHGSTGNQWGMAAVQAFEGFSSLSNNCLGQRVGIPRASNNNNPGNGCNGEQSRVFNIENEVQRITTTILNKFKDTTFTLGAPALPITTLRNNRAKAFAHFVRGLAVGYLALFYDSAAVVTPELGPFDGGELVSYQVAMDSALANLQTAIDYANLGGTGPASDGFPLPGTWVPSPTSWTVANFIQLVRTFRARLRANVARTPEERAAVNWDAVIADAQAGLPGDLILTTNSTNGPFNSWVDQFMSFTTWHQMTPFVIGMADGSDGAYQAWLELPLNNRGNTPEVFFMNTPDTRFPQGVTRTLQQADLTLSNCNTGGSVCKRYYINRPTGDDLKSGPSWGYSQYDHVRFYPWRQAGSVSGTTARNGPFPFFTKAEKDMLEAEGQYRKGNFALAGALVNITRTRVGTAAQPGGGLPAITIFDATTPVPGGAACVPKIPVGPPDYTNVACGNLWEAIKYEKRIETQYTHFAAWFLDMRGWGDLPEGTGTDWPVPYQDLQARGPEHLIYSTGGSGSGNTHVAARGTYGW